MAYTTTRRTRPSLMDRLRPRRRTARTTHRHHGPTTAATTTTTTTTTKKTTHHAAPATHRHRRRPSMGDKVSGAMMKLRGSLTRRPGLKAAGTRRMRGTDGRHTTVKTRRHY